MKKLLLLAIIALGVSPIASAAIVGCTVTSGTVLTSTNGGLAYSIANGIGTATGGATGVISCPAISTGFGFLDNYQVFASLDYQGGPTGTLVQQALIVKGGPLNNSTINPFLSSSNSPVAFQIGSTLSGATSYAAFTVFVDSRITFGGPVTASSGQVVVSYDVQAPPTGVPEPSSYALMTAGLAGLGVLTRRRK